MNLSGAIRKTIREALMSALDRDELELAMSDIDIDMASIASEVVGFEKAVNDLIDHCYRTDEVPKMLEGAIARNQKSRALRGALTAFRDWQSSPNAQADPLLAGWTSPTTSSPVSNQRISPPEGGVRTSWLPAGTADETTDPADLPAGLPRSEWDIVWAEVWQDQWPVMLDDMKVRLWRRVARRRSSAAQGPGGQASQNLPRVPGTPVRFGAVRTSSQPNTTPAGPGPTTNASAPNSDQEEHHG